MDVPPHRIPRRAFSRIYDLRPRLAVLAALLDDWASRPLHHYLPKWNIDYDDDALFPRRPPFELRRSCSARKPDDGLYWMFDDELLAAGRGGGLRRSHTHAAGRSRPRSVDEQRSLRRQYFEGRDDQDDVGEVHFNLPMTKNERQVPVQVQTQRSRVDGCSRVPTMDRPMFDRLQTDRPVRVDRSSPYVERPLIADMSSSFERPVPVYVEVADEQKIEGAPGTAAEKSIEPMSPSVSPAPPLAGRSEGDGAGTGTGEHQPITRNIRIDLVDDLSDKDSDAVTDGTLVPLSLLENERRTIRELKEENLRLKAVISNLQEVNTRWQSFNGDRQTYIQRLLTTIEEQQAQLNACLDTLRDSRPAPTSEAEASKMARLRSLQREVADLQRRLEEAKKEHRETVALLQMQVETHKDDWEAERREKKAAETRLRELSRKMGNEDTYKSKESNGKLPCKCAETKEKKRSRRSPPALSNIAEPVTTFGDPMRRCYASDIVLDGAGGAGGAGEQETGAPWSSDRDRTESQYAFSGEALSGLCGQQGQRQTESPSLSDALTPTPTPTPFQKPSSGYPVELSGSASSLGSCPAPHVSIPSSSRASTPDPDVSMCSDVTLDCSPPSPIQGTLTVGFNSSGLASVTSFRLRPVPLSTVPGSPDIDELDEDEAPVRDFWEVGAPTNSREDIVCPSCGDVFPPLRHLQFLDHFEVCASPSLSRPRR